MDFQVFRQLQKILSFGKGPLTPDQPIYHGTRAYKPIYEVGFKPSTRITKFGDGVYFTDHANTAWSYARGLRGLNASTKEQLKIPPKLIKGSQLPGAKIYQMGPWADLDPFGPNVKNNNAWLKVRGYDGLYHQGFKELVMFDEKQANAAVNNKGPKRGASTPLSLNPKKLSTKFLKQMLGAGPIDMKNFGARDFLKIGLLKQYLDENLNKKK